MRNSIITNKKSLIIDLTKDIKNLIFLALPLHKSNMEPQCHPEKSQARSESELKAEQDEFFLSGSANCVKLIGSNSENRNKSPSVAVLEEVIERPSNSVVKPPLPPTFKAALKPAKIIKSQPTAAKEDHNEDIGVTLDEISHENEVKLSKMSVEEIEELKKEIFESVPESFLNKILNKNSRK
jgi:hypothetical protein